MILTVLGIFLVTAVLLNKTKTRSTPVTTAPTPGSYGEFEGHLKALLAKVFNEKAPNPSLSAFNFASGQSEFNTPDIAGKTNRDGLPLEKSLEILVGGHRSHLEITAANEYPLETGVAQLHIVDFYYETQWMARSLVARKNDGSIEIAKTLHCSNPVVAANIIWGMHGRLA